MKVCRQLQLEIVNLLIAISQNLYKLTIGIQINKKWDKNDWNHILSCSYFFGFGILHWEGSRLFVGTLEKGTQQAIQCDWGTHSKTSMGGGGERNHRAQSKSRFGLVTYTKGLHQYSDISFEEFERHYLHDLRDDMFNVSDEKKFRDLNITEAPDEIDWRDKNVLTPVKDQVGP